MTRRACQPSPGTISDLGNLTFVGSPTLAGVNTYSGSTIFNANSLPAITNNQAFGTSTLVFNSGGFQASTPLTGPLSQHLDDQRRLGGLLLRDEPHPAFRRLHDHRQREHPHPEFGQTVTLSGLLSGGGTLIRATDTATSGNGGLVINNSGNTFSGGFTLQSNGGNVDVQGASTTRRAGAVTAGPLGTGPVTLNNANTTFSYLLNSSATPVTLANAVNIYDAAGFISQSGLTFTGTTTLTGPDNGGITQLFLGPNSNVTFAGVISSGTAKGINLRQVAGAASGGQLTLSGSNTFTGGTSISSGTLIAGGNSNGSAGVLGNSSGAISIGDANSAGNPAALLTNGAYTIGRPITVNATPAPPRPWERSAAASPPLTACLP